MEIVGQEPQFLNDDPDLMPVKAVLFGQGYDGLDRLLAAVNGILKVLFECVTEISVVFPHGRPPS